MVMAMIGLLSNYDSSCGNVPILKHHRLLVRPAKSPATGKIIAQKEINQPENEP
jgi:hypothetical protein